MTSPTWLLIGGAGCHNLSNFVSRLFFRAPGVNPNQSIEVSGERLNVA